METKSVDVYVSAWSHPSSEFLSEIVVKAQRLRRSDQSSDLPPQQPLLMVVSIKLTQKVYIVVPCYCAPSTTYLDIESEEEETETCAICLECVLDEDKRIYHMRNCSHLFHEECVIEWLNRQHNSCPLCRQPGYQITRV
ncbi:unnamed protein product [Arabidopsis halleri]